MLKKERKEGKELYIAMLVKDIGAISRLILAAFKAVLQPLLTIAYILLLQPPPPLKSLSLVILLLLLL